MEELCLMVSTNETLQAQFLCTISCQDAVHILEMHEENHSVAGILGSLDCMHERWKKCELPLLQQVSKN